MTDPTGSTTKRTTRAATTSETPASTKTAFPYEQYLEDRDGTPYLPLKWRLAWLRADQPQARIATRLVSHTDGLAVFRALIELPEGASATGWGAHSRAEGPSFGDDNSLDYITYAENQALSRALAALGYGTQYALDFDPPADHPTILLPETNEETDEEEPGIVVPMARSSATPPASAPTDEEDTDDEGEPPMPTPRPIAPVRGEIRNIAERRPAFDSRPSAPEPDDNDEEDEPPTPRPFVRPVANQPATRPPEVAATPAVGSSTVDDRIRNVRDDSLRVLIKQIYHEARQRFNYDEDAVDKRSVDLYKKPTNELNQTEADNYLERIITAPIRRR